MVIRKSELAGAGNFVNSFFCLFVLFCLFRFCFHILGPSYLLALVVVSFFFSFHFIYNSFHFANSGFCYPHSYRADRWNCFTLPILSKK
ncbi:hypothetical protein RhiirC2_275482 [Rhizophagus irregularis]|uniref:Uncharacterized protein n=1 Tax=Rhizophagus irregularis TaxID=588596 RepID=A0A2N1NLH4_9GLOM|nr:hypothetical protein RhiirC2_275482 [Rhizophagus irregularis]